MPKAFEAEVVNTTLDVPAHLVYAYARRMENLPAWASGLAAGVKQRDGGWFGASPMGEVRIDMAEANAFGVLDHDVTLPDGTRVHNAMRVTPCGEGSLLSFVVLRLPGVAQKDFDADVAHVRRDLAALKQLLEAKN